MIDRSRKSVGIEGPLDLSIYHAYGQWVDRGMAVDGDVRVDLPAGIYLVNVQREGADFTFTGQVIRR